MFPGIFQEMWSLFFWIWMLPTIETTQNVRFIELNSKSYLHHWSSEKSKKFNFRNWSRPVAESIVFPRLLRRRTNLWHQKKNVGMENFRLSQAGRIDVKWSHIWWGIFVGWSNNCWFRKVRNETKRDTPWKINMEPENTPLEKENHLPNHHFQVLC